MSEKSLQTRSKLADWGLKIKTVNESLVHAIDLTKKGTDFAKAFETAMGWLETVGKGAEYISEVFRPFKLIAKIAEDLTKITDPEKLGYIACTLAFQNALKQAVETAAPHSEPATTIVEVAAQLKEIDFNDLDFSTLDRDSPSRHEFFALAQYNAEASLIIVGFDKKQRDELLLKVQTIFNGTFRKILTHGDTADKFKPLSAYLAFGREDRLARKNLARHAEYQVWQFESAPVLGKEPFALKDVYIEPDCGVLFWKEIDADALGKRPKIEEDAHRSERFNPFDENYGGRKKMISEIIELLADAKNREPIIIQGIAGAGKTSFTLRLCKELVQNGQLPVRIRLRDLRVYKNIENELPCAVRISETERGDKNLFLDNKIFAEYGRGAFANVSRYVLILDGWDELSVSASEDFKKRVEQIIAQLRGDYIRRMNPPVKIVLTGRPTADVTNSVLLNDDTPILTVRDFSKKQLKEFIEKVSNAVKAENIEAFNEKLKRSLDTGFANTWGKEVLPPLEIDDWLKLDRRKFDSIIETYDPQEKKLEVLGLPLLAHLAARLIVEWPGDPLNLVNNQTTLYRNLVNLTCEKAGKTIDDESESKDELKYQSRITGVKLRQLLWGTASAMTAYGQDSIPYKELKERLGVETELKKIVEEIEKENWLTSLLISFYFKGGIEELGCEFSHKSFREYLFAEAIVEELKHYGQTAQADLPDLGQTCEDFKPTDARFQLSRKLSRHLAPQWLQNEVIDHLRNLLDWEIRRTKDSVDTDVQQKTLPLSLTNWRKVRDGLADVWGWWNYGVHLRPQMKRNTRSETVFEPAFVHELLLHSIPFAGVSNSPLPPSTAADAHLGEAFLYLNVFLHNFLRDNDEENKTGRRHQSIYNGEIRFKPAAKDKQVDEIRFSNFYHTVARINSKSGRPRGVFPIKMDLTAIDLSKCFLKGLQFSGVNLSYANLSYADLSYADLGPAVSDSPTSDTPTPDPPF